VALTGQDDALTRARPASYRSAHVGRRPGGLEILHINATTAFSRLDGRGERVSSLDFECGGGTRVRCRQTKVTSTHARRARHAGRARHSAFAPAVPAWRTCRKRPERPQRARSAAAYRLQRGDFEAFAARGGARISRARVPARGRRHCRGGVGSRRTICSSRYSLHEEMGLLVMGAESLERSRPPRAGRAIAAHRFAGLLTAVRSPICRAERQPAAQHHRRLATRLSS